MKEFEFVADSVDVNFKPKDKYEEILQNVKTILATPKGSRPMDREFGINFVRVDQPMRKEEARLTSEIVEAVNKYEPRAKVISVVFGWSDKYASLWPKVKIRINEE